MTASRKPTARDLLEQGTGLLGRQHLRQLGLERRAADAVFRACPTVHLPGYRYGFVRVEDYLALLEARTYRGDRVRPT